MTKESSYYEDKEETKRMVKDLKRKRKEYLEDDTIKKDICWGCREPILCFDLHTKLKLKNGKKVPVHLECAQLFYDWRSKKKVKLDE